MIPLRKFLSFHDQLVQVYERAHAACSAAVASAAVAHTSAVTTSALGSALALQLDVAMRLGAVSLFCLCLPITIMA